MKNIKYDIKNIKFVMGKEYPFRMQSNSINYQLKIDCDIIIYINIYVMYKFRGNYKPEIYNRYRIIQKESKHNTKEINQATR